MKQNLILVGNKIYEDKSKASVVDAFDFVIRVNRMNNLYQTGIKTDGYFLGMYKDFMDVYHGGLYKDHIKNIPKIFYPSRLYYDHKYTENHIFDYITKEQYDNIELIDIDFKPKHDMNIAYPTSTIFMLWHLLNSHWYDEYNIYLTGVDINNRDELFKTGDSWKNTLHSQCGGDEERWIKQMISENKVTVIE